MIEKVKYRPEIDGLRAIAVLAVVFFHLDVKFFDGGYVGVDVFFVISGYLIGSIILSKYYSGTWSAYEFYFKRAKRILPLYYFVVLVTLLTGWFVMNSISYEQLARNVIASTLFLSNLYLHEHSGYFDIASELNPLVHTWSLSIEEQFYFLLALSLIILRKIFFLNAVLVILFFISIYSALFNFYENETNIFYLSLPRAWELLAGYFLSLASREKTFRSDLLAIIGLALIFIGIFSLDSYTPFPGLATLLPVIGTVLIIFFCKEGGFAYKFLSSKLMVKVGILSFGIYLWHQPIAVYLRLVMVEITYGLFVVIVLLGSIITAYFSYNFIEAPIRYSEKISARFFWWGLAITTFLILVFTISAQDNNGFAKDEIPISLIPPSKSLEIDIYLLGDSHAGHLAPGLREITHGRVFDFSIPSCIPYRNLDRTDHRGERGSCAASTNKALNKLQHVEKRSIVIFSSLGQANIEATPFKGLDKGRYKEFHMELINNPSLTGLEAYKTSLFNTLREVENNPNLVPIFFLDIPELGIPGGCNVLAKEIDFGGLTISDWATESAIPMSECVSLRSEYDERARKYRSIMEEAKGKSKNVFWFDPVEYMCDSLYCYGFNEHGLIYSDHDHLNKNGSYYLASKLLNYLENIGIKNAKD